ncbi:MAG: UDP-2,3-diacylglucosamine diphosphatase [Candidatus Hydrogenedentota bacterium]
MKTLVFSDVHLSVDGGGSASQARFLEFLNWIDPTEVDRVIVLGDLFDFWFEYRYVVFSGYFEVLRALAALRDGDVELHFIGGNHDFWAGRFLRDELGFTLHPGETILPFGSERVLLHHGDGLNPSDWSYRLYKRIARTRAVIAAFRLLHPDWAMRLAQLVSNGSRSFHATDLSMGHDIEPLRHFAQRTLAEGRADVVMCGHCHYPLHETYETPHGRGRYINTGDWLFHGSFAEWEDGRFRLLLWDEEPQEIPCDERGRADEKARQ